MLKKIYLSFATILVVTSTVFCQATSTEDLNKRVQKDSVTYSWDKANEFVNGLENEAKLYDILKSYQTENFNLLKSYELSVKRNEIFEKNIVPELENKIKDIMANFVDATNLNEASKNEIKSQIKKKWTWSIIGTLIGFAVGVIAGTL